LCVEEGQPLKFTATFETVPPIEPGDYATITLHQKNTAVSDAASTKRSTVFATGRRVTNRSTDRGIQRGDSVVMDLARTAIPKQKNRSW
jgi:FKBP-type peptidyl-prolyl cis-trans isomerase (trigger factor)